jgi:hypothetical protein
MQHMDLNSRQSGLAPGSDQWYFLVKIGNLYYYNESLDLFSKFCVLPQIFWLTPAFTPNEFVMPAVWSGCW